MSTPTASSLYFSPLLRREPFISFFFYLLYLIFSLVLGRGGDRAAADRSGRDRSGHARAARAGAEGHARPGGLLRPARGTTPPAPGGMRPGPELVVRGEV
jgi:hypothetical protein